MVHIARRHIEQVSSRRLPDHTMYAFAAQSDDEQSWQQVQALIAQKQARSYAALVVIGIGGSYAGTQAVQEMVQGRWRDMDTSMPVWYADTVDVNYLAGIYQQVHQLVQAGKRVLLTIVSKSGSTMETVANSNLFIDLIRQYYPDTYQHDLVAITDKDSSLWQRAVQHGWSHLAIPADLGGRFSVLSAVGLFPLGMMGVDIKQLRAGARAMRDASGKTGSDAQYLAAWQYGLMCQGVQLHNLFLFGKELAALGAWWRQLVGESLGKAVVQDGQPNEHACVPLVSIGTTDLHSMGQLYFADIIPIATLFVTVSKDRVQLGKSVYDGKDLPTIMQAVYTGVQRSYDEVSLPYEHMRLSDYSAYTAGQVMQFFMHQVVYLAAYMQVNAFDQPEVERYKQHTRKMLSQ